MAVGRTDAWFRQLFQQSFMWHVWYPSSRKEMPRTRVTTAIASDPLPAWRGSRFAEISRNLEHLVGGFISGGFQSMYPYIIHCSWDAPGNKPSSCWGTMDYMGIPQHLFQYDAFVQTSFKPPTRDDFLALMHQAQHQKENSILTILKVGSEMWTNQNHRNSSWSY